MRLFFARSCRDNKKEPLTGGSYAQMIFLLFAVGESFLVMFVV